MSALTSMTTQARGVAWTPELGPGLGLCALPLGHLVVMAASRRPLRPRPC